MPDILRGLSSICPLSAYRVPLGSGWELGKEGKLQSQLSSQIKETASYYILHYIL